MTKRKTFQNKIFPELNSKKHILRNCGIAQNSSCGICKTWVSQKRNRAILREMTFANDCANCCFFTQNWYAKKEKFCVAFRKNCAKVLRMKTLWITVLSIALHFMHLLNSSLISMQRWLRDQAFKIRDIPLKNTDLSSLYTLDYRCFQTLTWATPGNSISFS